MIRAYKYEICPTQEQHVLLAKHFGANRFIYNWALDKKQKHYEQYKKSLSCYELMKELTQLKKEPNFDWLKEINAQSLQQSLAHLDVAFYNFFKGKAKFPKFKGEWPGQIITCNPKVGFSFRNDYRGNKLLTKNKKLKRSTIYRIIHCKTWDSEFIKGDVRDRDRINLS